MEDTENNIRIPFTTMKSEFSRILLNHGFSAENAGKCAEIFAVNSLEGVNSHGVNRFHRFVRNIVEGLIKPNEVPTLIHKSGSLEQWEGNLAPGPLNATFASDRATQLARENGIGLVALAHTNHWMRGGTYGWQAARKGFVFIGWTNTCPNMPAWGAKDARLGNNPFVFAVPYKNDAIVLDFAMSQFSYGKLETYYREGKKLPYTGGYNKHGDLTYEPSEILESWRPVPIGYWKGASLSLLLDILAAILSSGLATHEVKSCFSEYNVSQVYIAISLESLPNFPAIDNSIQQIIEDLKNSVPENEFATIRYPGENISKIRAANLQDGIPVIKEVWNKVLSL